MKRLTFVKGNYWELSAALNRKTLTLTSGGKDIRTDDFYPTAEVKAIMSSDGMLYPVETRVAGNVVTISCEMLPVGVYDLELITKDEHGHPLRYMRPNAIEIVEATCQAGIESGIEFDGTAYWLDGVEFFSLKGESGKDGLTPYIGENGHWWIGDKDSGVSASGAGQEQDPFFKASAAAVITRDDIDRWDRKQDAIEDLSAIRRGAERGAVAYHRPDSGIPSGDLDSDVQASLKKADTALQEHQDISGKADKSATYTKAETADLVKELADRTVQFVSVNGGASYAPSNGKVNLPIDGTIATDIAGVEYTDKTSSVDATSRKVQRIFNLQPDSFYDIDGSGDDWFSHTDEDLLNLFEANTLRLKLCNYDTLRAQVYAGRFRAPADDTTLVFSTDDIVKLGDKTTTIVIDGADDLSIEAGKLYEFNICAKVCIINCLEGL